MARAKTPIQIAINLDGPFFKGDPAKTFRQNGRKMLAELAEQGEEAVRSDLQAGESARAPLRYVSPSRVSGHAVGRVKSLTGKPWLVTAVLSVNNSGLDRRQGISLMAAAARLESRNHIFRKTAARLRKSAKINVAALLKGIA